MADENETKPRGAWTPKQIGLLVLAALALMIVVDFSQRLAQSQERVEQSQQVASEVAMLQAERSALQTQVAYATTDAAVIAWAHSAAKMVQGEEVLVVPIIPTGAPTPFPTPPPLPTPQPNYQLWMQSFVGASSKP
jgi:NAD(P)-dependent dehydrogenase (short-subunit alcohol dehydrogenase family)